MRYIIAHPDGPRVESAEPHHSFDVAFLAAWERVEQHGHDTDVAELLDDGTLGQRVRLLAHRKGTAK